ncbi:MAG: hypothetical protein DMG96_37795 [Acidobacteria bacterium]|nr:MAG: hypothetical protein DMG96_37795 [Acidobacteriota bacterium]
MRDTCESLFVVGTNGRPLTLSTALVWFRRFREMAGIKKKVTAHVFRHTVATTLLISVTFSTPTPVSASYPAGRSSNPRPRAFALSRSRTLISAARTRNHAAISAYAMEGSTLPSRHSMNGMK